MDKCVYCGNYVYKKNFHVKVITRNFNVCSQECKEKTEDYVRNDKKYKITLYMMMFVAAIIILLTLVLDKGMKSIYMVQILAGFAFFLFPYPVSSFGSFYSCSIRNVKVICKVIGLFFILFGVALLLLFA